MSTRETEDEHDSAATLRDDEASTRDTAALRRDATAGDRDARADARDEVSGLRDEQAAERDRSEERTPGRVGYRITEADLLHRTTARHAAVADRDHALADRTAWAVDRARAEDDRSRAEGDRGDAERDRSASRGDRGSSALDRRASVLDGLTGALRREAGRAALVREMARSGREDEPLVVAFVDVDQLKVVNDTDGHPAGDRLLRHVVAALRGAFRPYDLVIRQGGDEFLCVLPGMRATEVGDRMTTVNRALALTDRPGSITAGVAEMRPGDTDEQLVARADDALYARRGLRPPPV